jgi:hypothetical protein
MQRHYNHRDDSFPKPFKQNYIKYIGLIKNFSSVGKNRNHLAILVFGILTKKYGGGVAKI